MIYLDNAATTGVKPIGVQKAVMSALKENSANPGRSGHKLSFKVSEKIYNCRNKLAKFFGAPKTESVIFTANCTMAINMLIKGILEKGDHVIVSSLEHNAVMRPINKLKYKEIIDYDVAEVFFDDSDATFRSFERLVRPNTKLILCTHASNVIGLILPIDKIGELCREKGILFAVDAAQSAGVLPINMTKQNIDYLCVAPHKGLYAPMGTGVLLCSKSIKNTIIEGGTGTDSHNLLQPDIFPEKFESGTVNVPGILGISAGIDFINMYGTQKIYNHEIKLIQYAYNELSKNERIVFYTPYPEYNKYVPVISFNILGLNCDEVADILNKNGIAVRAGLHCAPTAHKRIGTIDSGAVRISTSIFNSYNDISKLVSILSKIKK